MIEVPTAQNGISLILRPFSKEAWLTFFALWLFYAFILYFSSYLCQAIDKTKKGDGTIVKRFTLTECFHHFSFSALQYGVDRFPDMIGGKVLEYWWSILMIILISLYTANMAAVFSVPHFIRPLSSIEEIPQSDVHAIAYKRHKLRLERLRWNNPILDHIMAKNRINFSFAHDYRDRHGMVEVVKPILENGFIFIGYDTDMEPLKKRIKHMYALDGYLAHYGYSFAMRKGWEMSVPVYKKFVHYSESGFFDYVIRKHIKPNNLERESNFDSGQLSFEKIRALFLITFLVGVLAILFQIIHSLTYRRIRNRTGID